MPSHGQGQREIVLHLRFVQKLTLSEIAKQTGVPQSTCQEWCQIFETKGKREKRAPPGRPRKVCTPVVMKKVSNFMKNKKHNRSVRKAAIHFSMVSKSSIHRILTKDLGLQAVRVKKRPFLNDSHKQRRLAFVYKHYQSDISHWVFTDEKRFVLNGIPKKNEFVWTNDTTNEVVYSSAKKYGSGYVEVWGAISKFGLPTLYFINRTQTGHFTAADFCDKVLETHIPEIVEIFHQQEDPTFTFVLDGDGKHNAKIVKNCLHQMVPNFIGPPDWPANSPDLNLIENVWSLMQNNVNARRPRTLDGLQCIIKEEWKKLSLNYINSLYENWQKCCDSVIAAQGGMTQF